MPEFFLELFSEEIPARMQEIAAEQLSIIAKGYLRDITLLETPVLKFYGPCRIAVAFMVNPKVPSISTEQRGPRANANEAAIIGFLRKNNAARENLRVEDGYFILTTQTPERTASEVILEKLPEHLAKFPWPKSMRWGQSGDFTWVRPLRRIVCLLDGEVIPIKLGPVTASNETEGHRFLAPGAFTISSAKDWQEKLRSHYVIADAAERRKLIVDCLNTKAAELGLTVVEDEGLINEVTGLVEWPVPLIGKIDENFMDLPPEVRELSMKVNQRYFALRDATGKPAPYFAFVANIEAKDGGAAIIAGNERVLRARLSDARHFWDLDLKTPLNELLPKLDKITFHAKIGTQRDRSLRISKLAADIAALLGANEAETQAARAAGELCKADLVTGMVGEFPELQGIMGGYYAEKNPRGWDGAIIGPAIATHYQPKGPGDAVPTGTIPIAVALADKLDTLREFFRIGEKPTGSGDPFALRRAALGVIRIILENHVALHLKPLLNHDNELFNFIIERLRVKLRGEGRRFDILDAVLGAGTDDDLVRIMQKVEAVTAFLNSSDGANLLAAFRRAANILRIEEAKDGPHSGPVDTGLFERGERAELEFNHVLDMASSKFEYHLAIADFAGAMGFLSAIRPQIDIFFEQVTVNAEESIVRVNRLRLLAKYCDTLRQIADFSKIEG